MSGQNSDKTVTITAEQKAEFDKYIRARLNLSAAVMERYAPIEMVDDGDEPPENTIHLYGIICDSLTAGWLSGWFGEDVAMSGADFRRKMKDMNTDSPLTLRINSPGGDVWEADNMINALKEFKKDGGTINAVVDGLAASAASLVMVMADKAEMGSLSNVMIHSASGVMMGTGDDMKKFGGVLLETDKAAADMYAKKMDKEQKEVLKMMDEETWFSADQAVEAGLIDAVVGEDDDVSMLTKAAIEAKQLSAQQNKRMETLFSFT